jgi:hypothetical protein
VVAPLAPERYKVQFTVSRDTYDKLRRVQDLLRHQVPDGDPAAIFDRAVAFVRDGRLATLEGYTFDDSWPENARVLAIEDVVPKPGLMPSNKPCSRRAAPMLCQIAWYQAAIKGQSCSHSMRSATIGSTRIARRAGK